MTFANRRSWVYRFMKRKKLSIRSVTHLAQKHTEEMRGVAAEFAASIRSRVQEFGLDPRMIANMDQTPCNYETQSGKTVSVKGSKTVAARTAQGGEQRVTVALSVLADGSKLPPLIVFQGTPEANGRTTIQTEINNWASNGYPAGVVYAVQKKAWMGTPVCMQWAEMVNRLHSFY
jgi:hypothetical protein